MTQRLYWTDPYQREFTARVVRRAPQGVVLDRTLFYPTSGGQPHDTGALNGVRVLDVVESGEEIFHVLEAPLEADEVRGVIDWDRRLDHMQQHDGQHILSEAFVRVCGAETSSFHLGKDASTIDLRGGPLSDRDVEAAEALANRVIWENRPIRIGWFSREEAAKLPVRKMPAVEGPIRIVHVQDFDCQPCCGTHARSSGEAGVVIVLGVERGRSESRVSFVCGHRALAQARASSAALKAAGAALSCGREEIVAAIERLKGEGSEARKAMAAAEKQLAEIRGRQMAASAVARGKARVVVEVFEGCDMRYVQTVANAIVAQPGLVAILGSTGSTSNVVLARSRDLEVDLRPIGKDVFAALGGKGGGQPHFVQGGGAGRDVREALRLAEERIVASLA